ncbi:MAG TPA: carbamoyltransferase C-terminal domain-containing protein [Candidatus Paceibacterota bacterium]
MRVLGLYCGHDASAAIVEDGKVVMAIEEERLTGQKKQGGFPARSVMYMSKVLGCSPWDFDKVMIATPNLHWGRVHAVDHNRWLNMYPNAELVPHHQAHAAIAYAWSGYDECTVLTLDGGGEHYFGSVNHAKNGKLERKHSLFKNDNEAFGMLYYYVTEALGFTPNRHEGKVMGLAARGEDIGLFDGLFWNDGPMIRAAGKREDNIVFRRLQDEYAKRGPMRREDVAASCQTVFEQVLTKWVSDNLASNNLAVSGGCFANVLANMKIAKMVDRYYVCPAMMDDGLSIGAALCAFDPLSSMKQEHVYFGPSQEARSENRRSPKEVAGMIATGRIVGLFQGKMEFGPRALGNRTILADPRDSSINDRLNKRLGRTEFMPFAPVILEDFANDILEDYASGVDNAPFMTSCWKVKDEWKERIPAVVHVDGTVRPQIIKRETNPFYYDCVEEFRKLTGIPVLINTSFNAHEDPILCFNTEADFAKLNNRVDVVVEA